MKQHPMQFDVGDWLRDPQLSMCSPATRGIWFDLLCVLHELGRSGQVTGSPEQFCRTCRCTPAEFVAAIAELATTCAADIHERNGQVTIINRRMQREHKERLSTAERVRRHRSNGDVTETKRESNNSPENAHIDINTISQEEISSRKRKSMSIGKKAKSPPDPRSKHPAIMACKSLMARYPDKSLYDRLIQVIGDAPDEERLRACREEWVKRGYNASAWTWALDWYKDGIPVRHGQNGGNHIASNGTSNQANDIARQSSREAFADCGFKAARTI